MVMKMKKQAAILIVFTLIFIHLQPVKAAPVAVERGSEFVIAYFMKNDEARARSYLAHDVEIPELREDTPIARVTGLPSPEENVSVVITYFEDERGRGSGRIAFIWEFAIEDDKITEIRVVYDGSNPHLNETNLINQFESKIKSNILMPYDYPFEITRIDGDINNNQLELNYQNPEQELSLQIQVQQNNSPIESFQDNDDQIYTLRNGIKALYKPDTQLMFQQNSMLYFIRMESEGDQVFQLEDFLKIANSMKYQ